MTRLLLFLFAPGEKLPDGVTHLSLSSEGLDWRWALLLLLFLGGAVAWSYRHYAAQVPPLARAGLIALRTLLVAFLLLLLVHPVLLVALEDSVRRPLLVLVDLSQSMTLKDHRTTADDLKRAAAAMNSDTPPTGDMSRSEIVEAVANNAQLNLWPQLHDKADLQVYGFGRNVTPLGELGPATAGDLTPAQSAAFFHSLKVEENLTALGDSVRAVLDQQRGQSVSGIVLITDGANNTGSPPQEAAELARQQGVPLYIYGVGIASPQDIIVKDVKAPAASNVNETAVVTAHLHAQNLIGKQITIQLMANGQKVDEQTVEVRADGDQEFNLSYTPTVIGDTTLEVDVPPLPEESSRDNNSASTKMRVLDTKLNVLVIEGEPDWDFQFLLAMLERDRRIKVKCFLAGGDPGLSDDPNSPFLDQLPPDRDSLFTEDVVILGDVNPATLGQDRMKMLGDLVGNEGAGLIFLAGRRFDPSAYADTPLKPLLPVDAPSGPALDSYSDPVKLQLTPAGESSSMLNLSKNLEENRNLWNAFPGVNWTASAGKPRPGAEVLLVDPTPSRATPAGPLPVIVDQNYGQGKTLYVGIEETYRWRAHVGEKYYSRIWGQILQAMAGQRTVGPSALTKLSSDRPHYFVGDKVTITARLFRTATDPIADPEAPGTLTVTSTPVAGKTGAPAQTSDLRLEPLADHAGFYTAQFTARTEGDYSFSLARDPKVVLKFDAVEPRIEFADTALNEALLRTMATTSGGAFFREETLHEMPARIASQISESTTIKKIPLAFSPFFLVLMIVAGCVEWFWRRRLEMK